MGEAFKVGVNEVSYKTKLRNMQIVQRVYPLQHCSDPPSNGDVSTWQTCIR